MTSPPASAALTHNIARTRWRIDPSRSQVQFQVPHFYGLMTVKGHFDRYDGTLSLNERPAIQLTIDADSLDTGNEKRDAHLRSGDFFDVEEHPQVTFASDAATLDGQQLKLSGRLHAAGKTVLLDLEATLHQHGAELEVDAATEVDHRQLGMMWSPLGIMRTPSRLTVRARLVPEEDSR